MQHCCAVVVQSRQHATLPAAELEMAASPPDLAPPMSNGVFVIKELSAIRDQLKWQLSALSEKEAEITEREIEVSQREALAHDVMRELEKKESSLKRREALLLEVEECVATYHTSIEECIEQEKIKSYQQLTRKMEADYYRVKKDNSRLKDGFTSICSINEKLKKQLEVEKLRSSNLERRVSTLQGRLSCFKVEHSARCKPQTQPQPECKLVLQNELQKDHHTKNQTSVCELAHPSPTCARESEQQDLLGQLAYHLMQWTTKTLVEETSFDALCVATFSLLAVLLPTIPVQYHYTCLQFICRVVLHTSSKTKAMLNTSLRRIGEVCAAPSLGIQSVRPAKIFCSSTDIRIRVLSALTILQTIAQVDAVNLALQSLRCDLRQKDVQREFIYFGGIQALLSYVSPSSKVQVLCGTTLDIFILLSLDSGITCFLSNDWFSAMNTLLKDDNLPSEQLEKVSILLQRLSITRRSKTLFARSEMLPILHSLLTSKKSLTNFIQLNISSTLNNLQ